MKFVLPEGLPKPKVALPPWEVLREALALTGNASAAYKEIQNRPGHPRLAAIVIGGWLEDSSFYGYLGDRNGVLWHRSTDDRIESPITWRTLKGAEKTIIELCRRRDGDKLVDAGAWMIPAHLGLVYWVHPDAHAVPLEQYIRMAQGNRFPGSPRR